MGARALASCGFAKRALQVALPVKECTPLADYRQVTVLRHMIHSAGREAEGGCSARRSLDQIVRQHLDCLRLFRMPSPKVYVLKPLSTLTNADRRVRSSRFCNVFK